MGRACSIEEVCHAIIHLTSQHSKKITGQIIHVDGGKGLSIRGQHTWWGMADNQNRGFEVGESTGVVDYLKMKLRKSSGHVNGKIINGENPNEFVEKNSTSLWGKKDSNMHINYAYQKPENNLNAAD